MKGKKVSLVWFCVRAFVFVRLCVCALQSFIPFLCGMEIYLVREANSFLIYYALYGTRERKGEGKKGNKQYHTSRQDRHNSDSGGSKYCYFYVVVYAVLSRLVSCRKRAFASALLRYPTTFLMRFGSLFCERAERAKNNIEDPRFWCRVCIW